MQLYTQPQPTQIILPTPTTDLAPAAAAAAHHHHHHRHHHHLEIVKQRPTHQIRFNSDQPQSTTSSRPAGHASILQMDFFLSRIHCIR